MSEEKQQYDISLHSVTTENAAKIEDPNIPIEEKTKLLLNSLKELDSDEKRLTIIESFKQYPSVLFWALFMSFGIVACGYDQALISTFYASPNFQKKYGVPDPNNPGSYMITAAWQTGLSMGSPVGQVIGPLMVPFFTEPYGRKKVMILFTVLLTCFNFIQFFAENIQTLCAGEIIAGVIWGTFVSLSPLYSSEISPSSMRPVVSSLNNIAFIIGQFVAAGVQAGCQNSRTDKWAYKIPFAVQWGWSLIIFSGIYWCPESPWWLVKKGKFDEAKKSMRSLGWKVSEDQLDKRVQIMYDTGKLEEEIESSASYMACFSKKALHRTEVTIMVFVNQILVGNWYVSYLTYFFSLAGLGTKQSFNLSVGTNAIGLVFCIASWWIMEKYSIRNLYIGGCFFLFVVLVIMGGLDCGPDYNTNGSIRYAMASMLILWNAGYQVSIGPITFNIMSEAPSTQLKSRSIGLSIATSSIFAIAMAVGLPYMFAAGWRGKTGFLFGGLSFLCFVWSYYRLPEMKNRTYQEIDVMFERGIPAREFEHYDCNANETLP